MSAGLQNAAPAARVPNNVSTFRSVAAATSAEPNLLVTLLRWNAALGRCRAFSCETAGSSDSLPGVWTHRLVQREPIGSLSVSPGYGHVRLLPEFGACH